MADNKKNEVDRIEVDSTTLGLHPDKEDVKMTYQVHDQSKAHRPYSEETTENDDGSDPPINIDVSAILKTPAGYDPYDERAYPSSQKGPWVITSPEDRDRDVIGFTNPNLHRRLDAKLPKDEDEVLPREYRVNLMNVDSYRTTKKNYHVDYQDLETWKEDNQDKYEQEDWEDLVDMIDDRAEDMEAREIP